MLFGVISTRHIKCGLAANLVYLDTHSYLYYHLIRIFQLFVSPLSEKERKIIRIIPKNLLVIQYAGYEIGPSVLKGRERKNVHQSMVRTLARGSYTTVIWAYRKETRHQT